jgi:hypothetical protein
MMTAGHRLGRFFDQTDGPALPAGDPIGLTKIRALALVVARGMPR